MAVFVISDLHLSLSDDKPMDVFGGRWTNYIDKIKENWNSNVSEDDSVIIPGDISWSIDLQNAYEDLKFLCDLNGKKYLFKGNHDYWWSSAKKLGEFKKEKNLDSLNFLFNDAENVEDITICGTRGWYSENDLAPDNSDFQLIVNREAGRLRLSLDRAKEISAGREIVAFFHFPPVFSDYVCKEIVDVLSENNIKKCYFGHIHGVYDIPSSYRYNDIDFELVSADYLNFVPQRLEI